MSTQAWYINTSDTLAAGFLAGRDSLNLANNPRFIRNSDEQLTIYLLEYINQPNQIFQDVDLTDFDSMQVGVGPIDEAPTGGTFALSANGTSTNLTALAYNVSAATLETALDAIEPVSVVKVGNMFVVTVVATNTSITWTSDPDNLTPPSQITISNPTPAAVGVQAIYTIELEQAPYAYSDTWTPRDTTGDGVTITQNAAGTASVPARYTLAISPDPIGGAFRFLWGQPQKALVSVQSNAAAAQVWTIDAVADSAGSLAGKYFDLSDANGPVRVWMDFNSAVAPDSASNPIGTITSVNSGADTITSSVSLTSGVPIMFTGTPPSGLSTATNYYPLTTGTTVQLSLTSGGAAVNITSTTTGATINKARLLPVSTLELNDTQAIVAGKVADALNADAAFLNGATIDADSLITCTAAAGGVRMSTSGGTSGFTVGISTTGSAGQLQGQGFVLDDSNGTVGVYVTVGGLPATVPAFAAACTRQIAVAVAGGASANTAASTIQTTLAADSQFTNTTVSSNTITAVCTDSGERAGTTTVSSSSYFSTTISQVGAALSVPVEATESAASLEAKIGDYWSVAKPLNFTWVITRLVNGTPTAPTVSNGDLQFAQGLVGTLSFNTLALAERFQNETVDTINETLEVTFKLTGDTAPRIALQLPVPLTRDLLNGSIVNNPIYPGSVALLGFANAFTAANTFSRDSTGGNVVTINGTGTLGNGLVVELTDATNTDDIFMLKQDGVDILSVKSNNMVFDAGIAVGWTGGVVLTSAGIDMNGGQVNDVGAPSISTDAATKGYVDTWLIKTGTYTAVNGDKIQADTSGGAFTITLPASASAGDSIHIEDGQSSWNTNNLTIARNGLKINGGTSNFTGSTNGQKLSLVYISAGYGWSVK